MNLLIVTGCDAHFFNTTLAFCESYRSKFPLQNLRVCDFGLDPGQKGFFRELGLLLEWPPILPPGSHPYLCKAHLHYYLAGHEFEALLWIDSDTLIGDLTFAEIAAHVEVLRKSGKDIALCPNIDGFSIETIVAGLREDGYFVTPFAELLDAHHTDVKSVYLSSGVMLFLSRRVLVEFAELCRAVPLHSLWEQNVLNILCHDDLSRVEIMDSFLWQIYDSFLADIEVPDPTDTHRFEFMGRRVKIVHASSRDGHHHWDTNLALDFGIYRIEGYLRLFVHSDLQRIQLNNLMAMYKEFQPSLVRFGLLPLRTV